eukprot:GSChrysophyteH2.ASY1.ANO1.536.1 assembled CDS
MLEETQNGVRVYAYDQVFGVTSTNAETYEMVGRPVVLKAMQGFNGTVFTYGQTGSGKTWTMRGCDADPGMMILCIDDIFTYVKDHSHEFKYTLRVSYMEVYNEEINDLLQTAEGEGKNLKITAEDAARGAVIGTLVEEEVNSPDEFMQVLYKGEAARSYASTTMNDNSSRSHVIYHDMAALLGNKDDGAGSRISYMNLVDLAGSERQKSTNATGKTLKEGANINKSLLALGAVIGKLGESGKAKKGSKAAFIPYRDSKLTRILKQSLGGNTLTSILVAVTPAEMFREETVSSLKFGQMCKKIKNSVSSNVKKDPNEEMNKMKAELAKLKMELAEGGGGNAKAMAAKERAEYSNQFEIMKELLVKNNVDVDSIAEIKIPEKVERKIVVPTGKGKSGGGGGGASSEELQDAHDEIVMQAEKIADMTNRMRALQTKLAEHGEIAEARAACEEYERNSREEIEEETSKFESAKQTFSIERYQILQDRTNLDEKETRVGSLLTNLDEKDSKLRQILGTLKEQQEQWQRAVNDLQRREDLVEEWQRNHRSKEKKLEEINTAHGKKFEQLNEKEKEVLENEATIRAKQRELLEREQRLQVALSRTAKSEQAAQSRSERLNNIEADLNRREHDCDMRDREMKSRGRELESWDVLLREKDKKISEELKKQEEREKAFRVSEEEFRVNRIDYENAEVERKEKEMDLIAKTDALKVQSADTKERERQCHSVRSANEALKQELDMRETAIIEREELVTQLMEQVKDLEDREISFDERVMEHKAKENNFFNVQVKSITTRHSKEMQSLEDMVQVQLALVNTFQAELDKVRTELHITTSKSDEYARTLVTRERLIEQLRSELRSYRERGLSDPFSNPTPLGRASSSEAGAGVSRASSSEDSNTDLATSGSKHSKGKASDDMMVSHAVSDKEVAKKELVMQLADTQRVLHEILQSNASTPSKRATLLRKGGGGSHGTPGAHSHSARGTPRTMQHERSPRTEARRGSERGGVEVNATPNLAPGAGVDQTAVMQGIASPHEQVNPLPASPLAAPTAKVPTSADRDRMQQ